MRSMRFGRVVSICAAAAMVVGAFSIPAEAAKKKKCPKFTPAAPNSPAEAAAEAPNQPIVPVTDKHTAEAPLVIEYEHGPGLWLQTQEPVEDDTKFFNLQIASKAPTPALNIRQEWGTPSVSDMDLYLYDAAGEEVASSGAANVTPTPLPGSTGAMGYEEIAGFAAARCAGYTIESRNFLTEGEAMTLRIWLSPPA